MKENKDDAESLKEKTKAQSKASRIMLSDRNMEFKAVINEMKQGRNNLGKADKYKNEKGGQG
ncbi:MAG: hypothetical protein IIC39_00570 [Candidatus Marinimicrobia bacterium]|nr:hypothetical protein [Candidatus Neomarinimicrobiota bacterium]